MAMCLCFANFAYDLIQNETRLRYALPCKYESGYPPMSSTAELAEYLTYRHAWEITPGIPHCRDGGAFCRPHDTRRIAGLGEKVIRCIATDYDVAGIHVEYRDPILFESTSFGKTLEAYFDH